jgi:hypothetical protein
MSSLEKVPLPEAFPAESVLTANDKIRAALAAGVLLFVLIVFGAEVFTCFKVCKDVHEVKDTFEPFVAGGFAALGSAITFYFTDRRR